MERYASQIGYSQKKYLGNLHRPKSLLQIKRDQNDEPECIHYIVAMKNPRDMTQVARLAKEMYPGNTMYAIEAYQDAIQRSNTLGICEMS